MRYACYNPITGEISHVGDCTDVHFYAMGSNGLKPAEVTPIAHPDTHYFVIGEDVDALTLRPEMPITQEGNTFTEIPEGAVVYVSGEVEASATITGGLLELEFDQPGQYLVRFELFPFVDYETTHHET